MKKIKLNNGVFIPVVGSGTNTFGKKDNSYNEELRGDTQEMDWAIENGYRHFDTAQSYRTETVVGEAIEKSGIDREEFFITSKLQTSKGYFGSDWAHEEIAKSLKALKTDYIDLFLIHHPWDNQEEILEAWHIFEDYYEKGIFKAIGVSNFDEKLLDYLIEHGDITPAANQIESHAGKWNDELIAYNQSHDIASVAWSPLAGVKDNPSAKEKLEEIGAKYDKSFAQVLLRYQIERDVIVIPKSHNKERQAEGIDIFDFELTEEDREVIQNL